MKAILIALAFLGLAGCFAIGDSRQPIASETFVAPSPSRGQPLVIVLPGFGVDAKEMKERGVVQAIQGVWPEAEVQLASATFAYYRDGNLVGRLHEELVGPAIRAGRHVWLVGASLGGMGALLYEQQHPGTVTGIVLFAPFVGDSSLLQEIRKAGGPRAWNPGELPAEITSENYQRQVWKMVKSWADEPQRARRVWLACGDEDRLLAGARLLATALPGARYVELKGGHTWNTWLNEGKAVFSRIRSES